MTTIYNKSVSSLCGETGTDVGTDSESYQNEFTDHGDEVEYVEPILDGTSLSCAGRELTTISVELGEKFGEKTLTLDLSFNLLEYDFFYLFIFIFSFIFLNEVQF